MEHAYLRVALERTLGLNVTRGKSLAVFPASGEILAPQANAVGVFTDPPFQIETVINLHRRCESLR